MQAEVAEAQDRLQSLKHSRHEDYKLQTDLKYKPQTKVSWKLLDHELKEVRTEQLCQSFKMSHRCKLSCAAYPCLGHQLTGYC